MAEIEKIEGEGRKGGPGAIISTEGNYYNITYYVPARQAIETIDREYTIKIPPDGREIPSEDTDMTSAEDEENAPLLSDHRELYIPSDLMDLSAKALSYLDNNQYRISYYIKLRDYYKEKQEYEEKRLKYEAGEKDIFKDTTVPAIFYSKETSALSASALSEIDGRQHRMSYYVKLEDYYEKAREYEEKMLYYKAGDIDIFKEKPSPLIFYSKESTDLSDRALSDLDGKQHKMSYYKKLRVYQKEREEYEKKLLLYELGQTDIFEKKDEPAIPQDKYSLSAEALSYADGEQHKYSYYEKLSNYYSEIQNYNKKLKKHNEDYEDNLDGNLKYLISRDRESVDLTARALSELDNKQYRMSYYQKLADYNKKVDEYERKTLLYNAGDREIFHRKEESFTQEDKVEIGSDENKVKDINVEGMNTKDYVSIGTDKENEITEVWTPQFNDMIATLKGKVSPYFMDNLFETMQKVNKKFDPAVARYPVLKLYLTCSTELVSEEELIKELERV